MPKIIRDRRKSYESDISPLPYIEGISAETLGEARRAYDAMHERIYKFATLTLGGASAIGLYVLRELQGPIGPQVASAAAVSIWWFIVVAALIARGGASRSLKAGTSGDALRERYSKHLRAQSDEATALWYTRWDQITTVSKQADEYAYGTTQRAKALDAAQWCLAGTPVIAFIGYFSILSKLP